MKNPSRNKSYALVMTFILFFIILAIIKFWPSFFKKNEAAPEAPYVETLILKPQTKVERFQALGTVKAAHDIIVSSEVSGIIQRLNVANGQHVKAGEILLTIHHDENLANLQKDQAILTQKNSNYLRLQQLIKLHAVSEAALNEALSDYQQAESAVKSDKALLEKFNIKAPFSGTIGIWQVDIGQFVKPGDALVTLTELSPAYIDFMLPAKALGGVSVGDYIQFTTESFMNITWQGKVIAIDPQLDFSTRSVKLRAQIDNKDGKLVPRLYGQITVIKPLASQLLIPQEAVIYDPKGASVYIVEKNVVKLKAIVLGNHQENDVFVNSGLQSGDEIVTAGMMKLYNGMTVTVNKKLTQSAAKP